MFERDYAGGRLEVGVTVDDGYLVMRSDRRNQQIRHADRPMLTRTRERAILIESGATRSGRCRQPSPRPR